MGWSIAGHIRFELVDDALEMPAGNAAPIPGRSCIQTADPSQYTPVSHANPLRDGGG